MKCPYCGSEAEYIIKYKKYYCRKCKKYLAEKKGAGLLSQVKNAALLIKKKPVLLLPAALPALIYLSLYLAGRIPLIFYNVINNLELAKNIPQEYNTIISLASLLALCAQLHILKNIAQGTEEPLKTSLKKFLKSFPKFFAGMIIIQVIQSVGFAFLVIPGMLAFLFLFYTPIVLINENLSYKNILIYSALIGKTNWKKTTMLILIFLPIMAACTVFLPAGIIINTLLLITLYNTTMFLVYANVLKKPAKPEESNENQLVTIITILVFVSVFVMLKAKGLA